MEAGRCRMKDLWDRWSSSAQKRGRAPPPSPLPFHARSLSLPLSFFVNLPHFSLSLSLSLSPPRLLSLPFAPRLRDPRPPPSTSSDASRGADQRDFCLKHDLSLKYLKPDYLWVCHLGRRDVTPAGRWQDPSASSCPLRTLFLPFFSLRTTRLCR